MDNNTVNMAVRALITVHDTAHVEQATGAAHVADRTSFLETPPTTSPSDISTSPNSRKRSFEDSPNLLKMLQDLTIVENKIEYQFDFIESNKEVKKLFDAYMANHKFHIQHFAYNIVHSSGFHNLDGMDSAEAMVFIAASRKMDSYM